MAVAQTLSLLAPAKLNLFLHVLGQRPDGYHDLQSAFRCISLFDALHLACLSGSQALTLTCDTDLGDPQDNLVLRAAELLQQRSGTRFGAQLTLEKQIPVGAGLGGGSSDAAAVLVGLNHLWSLDFSKAQLQRIGADLGADIPFFIQGGDAWVSGLGEHIEPLSLPESWYVVGYPRVVIPTAEIFTDPDLTRDAEPSTIARFLGSVHSKQWRNDLEGVAIRRYPEVGQLKNWLSSQGAAKMSGSGSAVFLEVASQAEAQALVALMPTQWQGFKVAAGGIKSLQRQISELDKEN
ncbi:MAG: 4-(cytidine 5'-diphospho)-2-C-methyl-D-erythritol kinase [Pseudomonadales bacterium]|jgi:4-diphosphocytidyl-2-C-methyl-D-erythritol kinase|tara:strand:+ start:827 stop:1705 length:879 start_codon:yes stop_codon:yes gene_type:complete